MENQDIYKGMVWDLYREHIKKFSHAQVKGYPSEEEQKSAFQTLLPDSTVKVLAQEKVGMVVQFHFMDRYKAMDMAFVENVKGFLSERFGGGKFKLNLYNGINFLSTKNFETEGPPLWKDMIKEEEEI
ncbi:MAG TPA: hypothetical protein VGB26_13635 [Nitrospiria bacterium]|jgi:hypothetical protein